MRQDESARPPGKRVLHAVRRAHLYTGLMLLPWVVLYGVTAFLFNHPAAFADAPTVPFGADALAGTPLEAPPSPEQVADEVVAALNARAPAGAVYTRTGPAPRYNREFAFVTVRAADGRTVGVLFDALGRGGTARLQPAAGPPTRPAPFAIGGPSELPRLTPAAGLTLPDTLPDRIRAAGPVVLPRLGFPAGKVTISSVPDVVFTVTDGSAEWQVTYNALSGSVTGQPAEAVTVEPLSARRYLLRLHTAHGYPAGGGVRWWWAVVVDLTAGVMVFWAASGLLMWWQVKAARRAGGIVLLISAAAATTLAVGMSAAVAP